MFIQCKYCYNITQSIICDECAEKIKTETVWFVLYWYIFSIIVAVLSIFSISVFIASFKSNKKKY